MRDEIDMLEASGIEVSSLLRNSDDIDLMSIRSSVKVAAGPIYNQEGTRQFVDLLERDRPDLIHFHNLYPLVSPNIVSVAHKSNVPMVQTVHNYRHTCIAGTHFRSGEICTLCSSKRHSPGVLHKCYRDSGPQSVAMTLGKAYHQDTWKKVSRFIVLSEHMRTHLIKNNFDSTKIVVRPTFSNPHSNASIVNAKPQVLFLGRLDQSKGLDMLLDAWQQSSHPGLSLVIAGSGPLEGLADLVARRRSDVTFMGRVDALRAKALLDESRLVIVPSRWWEGFPRTIAEAFAAGRPVAAARVGSLENIVQPDRGWLFEPKVEALRRFLETLSTEQNYPAKAKAAFDHWASHLRPDLAMKTLLGTYKQAIAEVQR